MRSEDDVSGLNAVRRSGLVASSTTGLPGDAFFAEEGYRLVKLGPEVCFEGAKLWVSGDKTTTETVRREFIRVDEPRSFRVSSDVLADGLKVAAFLIFQDVVIGLILKFKTDALKRLVTTRSEVLHRIQLIAAFR